MAVINKQGNVIAHCPGCDGGKSTFEYANAGRELGYTTTVFDRGFRRDDQLRVRFQLFRCAGCGRAGLGTIRMMDVHGSYPDDIWELLDFYPEAKQRLSLPKAVPNGIQNEFREAEMCVEHECYRAGAAMFRSVLDKTMRANGYKTNDAKNLRDQIDAAAADGVITPARQRRAHDEVRVLGNDVLHDDWRPVSLEDVEAAHHYVQRILEDFYDDRGSVLKQLRKAKRVPNEDKAGGQSS
jgi:hypothetical protein